MVRGFALPLSVGVPHERRAPNGETMKLDTTESLQALWNSGRRSYGPRLRARMAAACAVKWERRAAGYARAGEFREAEEADGEARALWCLLDAIRGAVAADFDRAWQAEVAP